MAARDEHDHARSDHGAGIHRLGADGSQHDHAAPAGRPSRGRDRPQRRPDRGGARAWRHRGRRSRGPRGLAPPDGWLHVGPAGAGHFAKMIHNGIEYGLMQSYAEGFEILRASEYGYDLERLSHLWNQGSVVRSWLLELAERAFAKDPGLERIRGYVEDSGEGRWTVEEAIRHDVPAPLLTLALLARFRSRQADSFRD